MSFIDAKIVSVSSNPEEYFKQVAERGSPGFEVSSSMLRAFESCPARWKAGYEPPDSEAKAYGSLLDCRLLTPEQFDKRYAIKPATYEDAKTGEEKPWNGNSNVCKAWLEDHEDMEIVTAAQVADADAAIKAILADPTLYSWHEACEKQVWVSGHWKDKKTGIVVPVKCLIDYVPRSDSEFCKAAGDLKTTRSAAQGPFRRWCYSAGYHVQGAFDLALLRLATGRDITDWCLVLSENFAPWQIGRRIISEDLLDMGRKTYEYALEDYCMCLKTGKWPGYDDNAASAQGWGVITTEDWMQYQQLSQHMERQQQEEEAPGEEVGITP